jgi:hypothetical protein
MIATEGEPVHVRINTIYGDESRIDAAIDYIEGEDRAVVEAAAGNNGLTTLVDRHAALIVAASYWDEPVRSSEAALTRVREIAVTVAGGDLSVETYEVLAAKQRTTAPAGATVHFARLRVEPDQIGDAVAYLTEQVLPGLTARNEPCDVQVLLDRSSGAGIVVTTWEDDALARAALAALEQRRHDAAEQGVKLLGTETYTMVRTSLRID